MGASTGEPLVVCVVMVVVVVVVVVFVAVTVVLRMSMSHSDQPYLFVPLEFGQFVRAETHLLFRDSKVEARLRLWASFFGQVDEPIWTGLLKGRLLVLTGAEFWRPNPCALSTVDCAGWEDGRNNCSQALSGPGSYNGLWSWVGDVHPSGCVTPELIGLPFNFSLSL